LISSVGVAKINSFTSDLVGKRARARLWDPCPYEAVQSNPWGC